MSFEEQFKESIFNINDETFSDSSLAAFDYQYHNCEVYRTYCEHLKKTPINVRSITEIPFLPIAFFKNHAIKSGVWNEEKVFKSSGTTGSTRSRHFVKQLAFYHSLSKKIFESNFGSLNEFQIVAFLPSYIEQGDSSLISMIDHFMHFSASESGYFLDNKEIIDALASDSKKLVFGVSFALLDLADIKPEINNAIIIETGGMKGRKKEITRNELHEIFQEGFGVKEVWSEYGMTELISQAYGPKGVFQFPSWAKCLVRDINDPFSYQAESKTGGINIIDLGNIDSCCFIETKDLGRITNGKFEVLGRFDNSDVRGCNLLI